MTTAAQFPTRAPERAIRYWAEKGHTVPHVEFHMHQPGGAGCNGQGVAGKAWQDMFGGWHVDISPRYVNRWHVVAHELGHVLGLRHEDAGTHTIMAPSIDAIRP